MGNPDADDLDDDPKRCARQRRLNGAPLFSRRYLANNQSSLTDRVRERRRQRRRTISHGMAALNLDDEWPP